MKTSHIISRRKLLLCCASAGAALLAHPVLGAVTQQTNGSPAAALRATHWAQRWLKLVVKYQQNPLRAARSAAYIHAALQGAWVQSVKAGHQSEAVSELSAHRAASLLMQHFYPNETPGHIEAQYAWMVTQITTPAEAEALAHSIGTEVAQGLIKRSLLDGAGRVWPLRDRPADFPGMWQATYPLYAVNPAEAFCGTWRPWVQPSAGRYVPPPAHRPGSSQHADETQEVYEVFQNLTPQQRQAAFDWNLESGSVTPPGVWMQHTIANLLSQPPMSEGAAGFERCVNVLAVLCMAMHDAFIACWGVKFRDWSERPITAVRRQIDKDFIPIVVTPGFPSYVSGHATVSGAAAVVLSSFWPSQAAQFNAMAQEAAMSRLWGGIHFRSDNDEGLRLGTAVGQDVIASLV